MAKTRKEAEKILNAGLTTVTTNVKQEDWKIDAISITVSLKQLEAGLRSGEYFILPADVDAEHAIVMERNALGKAPIVVAHLKHSGGTNSYDIKYKVQ